MGVQGLWSLLGPAARPTQLDSLRQKKIAVDASIWIHQFMRTMRDKEGNALRNGHLLGFFRRLCKLLFFDIKPIFVFDGGAPALKRTTIRERRKRREGIKVNLRATAKKILSAQVKSRVLLEQEKKLHGEELDENFVYAAELEKTAQALRKPVKLDQYELPDIPKNDYSHQLDPRLATRQEIQNFVDEFAPSELDVDSDTFQSLPPEIQYEVIQDLKNKSRQTSWARLDQMVRGSATALDFSKHQIRLLKHRNTMTQRLMQMNTVAGGNATMEPARIAGERGRQYILYKNEDLDQGLGWKLPGLTASEPFDLDPTTRSEPKLQVPMKSEPEDKVKAAIASNPKLAALFNDYLDEEEEKREAEILDREMDKENDEPLFEPSINEPSQEPELMNDMRAYMDDGDDDAINQVISRIYPKDPVPIEQDISLTLDIDDFYKLWISRMPDAFVYLHSINDEHLNIIRSAIEEDDVDKLRRDLKSIRKQRGKTNEIDELALESFQFHEAFLESVIAWNERNFESQFDDFEQILREEIPPKQSPVQFSAISDKDIQFAPLDSISEETVVMEEKEDTPLDTKNEENVVLNTKSEETVVLDEEEDDQDIHFVDVSANVVDLSVNVVDVSANIVDRKVESSQQDNVVKKHVHIDIHQSLLHKDEDLDKDNVNNEEKEPSIINQDEHEIPNDENIPIGYNSEDELGENIDEEDNEYARFVSDIASKNIDDIRKELRQDIKELNQQQKKNMGNTDDITDQMVQDIQELLKLFGIPYIVSPMEAEAQCAELEALSLVDGTITDDSDVFLFGAGRVYKNMFNQQRFVECYQIQDIDREMILNRKKFIQLAFLLGSDYTEGIPGVGPVTAMEILSEFSNLQDKQESLEAPLIKFKNWYNGQVDDTPFKRKFRKQNADIDIPVDFPNQFVKEAYYNPTVDKSTKQFEWGEPQLDTLRIFLSQAFGWSDEKTDQILLPVLREMNNRKSAGEQQVIGSFFNVSGNVSSSTSTHKHSSKRVQSIVEKWRKQKKTKK